MIVMAFGAKSLVIRYLDPLGSALHQPNRNPNSPLEEPEACFHGTLWATQRTGSQERRHRVPVRGAFLPSPEDDGRRPEKEDSLGSSAEWDMGGCQNYGPTFGSLIQYGTYLQHPH